jgi:hypothetical protein
VLPYEHAPLIPLTHWPCQSRKKCRFSKSVGRSLCRSCALMNRAIAVSCLSHAALCRTVSRSANIRSCERGLVTDGAVAQLHHPSEPLASSDQLGGGVLGHRRSVAPNYLV